MWCGKEGLGDKSLDAVMAMAGVADRLGMTEVGAALEDAIVRQLSVDVCGDVLMGAARLRLGRVEAAARVLTLEWFDEVAGTEGFMRMDEGTVGSLLDDDMLRASREEAGLEAVVGWMKGAGGELRGRGLMRKIRYCVLGAEVLAADVHRLLPAGHADWIDGLVLEALRIKASGGRRGSIGARVLGRRRKFVGHGLVCGGSDAGQVASGGFEAIRVVSWLLLNAMGGNAADLRTVRFVCGTGQLWSTSVPCATSRIGGIACGVSQLGRGILSAGIAETV
jgi:hypothetical protein